jgi:prepilin-type N-terminal cleavage/methylation domain-containing protein
MEKQRGFSLMELLVVMAIITVVAAVAIPTLILSRLDTCEAGAIQGCKEIAAAEFAYAAAHQGQHGDLPQLVTAGLIDARYAREEGFNGYRYFIDVSSGRKSDGSPAAAFGILARPLPGNGRYLYTIGPDPVVRFKGAAPGFSLPEGVAAGDPVGK